MRKIFGLVAGLGGLLITPALASTYSSGSPSLTGVGAEFPSIYDEINITGKSGTFLNAGQSGIDIGDGSFVVGYNCNLCTSTTSGNITDTLSVNGSVENFLIHWTWSSNFVTDFLKLSLVNNTLNFGNYTATLNLSGNNFSSSGGTVPFELTANISQTPLPAALPLFAGGLGLVGFLARRRKRKAAVAVA